MSELFQNRVFQIADMATLDRIKLGAWVAGVLSEQERPPVLMSGTLGEWKAAVADWSRIGKPRGGAARVVEIRISQKRWNPADLLLPETRQGALALYEFLTGCSESPEGY